MSERVMFTFRSARLLERVTTDAASQGSSVQNVINDILHAHYNGEVETLRKELARCHETIRTLNKPSSDALTLAFSVDPEPPAATIVPMAGGNPWE